jgi:acetyltransferase-like isoleucine patch superfamily enzyme
MNDMRLIFRALYKITDFIADRFARVWMRALGVQLGRAILFRGYPIVSLAPGSSISIGDRAVLCSQSRNTALGVNHPVVLRTLSRNARIVIGPDVGISGGSICAATEVVIGGGTLFGANVTIADTDFHPLTSRSRRYDQDGVTTSPVAIGKNVFIGTGAIVLKGVTIGDNSVIGAGSVVTRSIAANSIAAGNPCRVLKAMPFEALAPSGAAL